MPHLHVQPGGHDYTVSAFIMRQFDGVWKVLLVCHKKYSWWIQPGGHVEHTENPWQAVAHEILEETGYRLEQLQVLQPLPRMLDGQHDVMHPVPAFCNTHQALEGHFHSDSAFVFTTDEDPAAQLAPGESAKLGWFTLEELKSLDHLVSEVPGFIQVIENHILPSWNSIPARDYTL